MAAFPQVPAAWRPLLEPVLESPEGEALRQAWAVAHARGTEVLPPASDVFAALALVAPQDVRVVIVGQDPYPTPGHAHGLAFSYRGPGALPRSLRNIFAEMERDLGAEAFAASEASGDLRGWASQGVLLLNAVLTVQSGRAGAHRAWGWQHLTRAVLAHLAARTERIVFVLWGRQAERQLRGVDLDAAHVVLRAGHPSPLSVRYFSGCGHFSQIQAHVRGAPIAWCAHLPTGPRA